MRQVHFPVSFPFSPNGDRARVGACQNFNYCRIESRRQMFSLNTSFIYKMMFKYNSNFGTISDGKVSKHPTSVWSK